MHNFKIGELYNRVKDIHEPFGGIRMTGISPSASSPFIFLFTGAQGEQYGYSDGWKDGVFHYTGEGQVGDMKFTNGNKAIRDHVKNGKDILIFQHRSKVKAYQYMGEFSCTSYENNSIPDKNGDMREGITFHLINIDEEEKTSVDEAIIVDQTITIKDLRSKALEASNVATKVGSTIGKKTYFYRSQAVKAYVLKRSNGLCECCGQKAPFLKKDGSPYLEPHHIRKLSDAGLDHPQHVAAITPNCHREIHHGQNGDAINQKLAQIIADKETLFEKTGNYE